MLRVLGSHIPTRSATARLRRFNSEEASGLVEYALVLLLLMTMLLGIVDFSRVLYAYHFVSNAARDATRWAAVNGSTCNGDGSGSNPGSCTAPVTCGSSGCSTCTSYGSCTYAGATDIENYVTMLAVPAGINTSATGCSGSPCLTTTPTWPTQTNSPASCSTTGHNNDPGCTVQVKVSYTFSSIFAPNATITLSSTSEMIIVH
jgi:Flp pilus assembly protein TadG